MNAPSRTPADYAIEHAGYLAEAAKLFMQSVMAVQVASQQHEDAEPGDEAREAYDVLHGQEELLSERWNGLRSAVYEFEKRRDRALAARPAEGDAGASSIVAAIDAEIGEGWTARLARCLAELKVNREGK